MKKSKKLKDFCKCGHDLDEHDEGCPKCGFGECHWVDQDDGFSYCECEEYESIQELKKAK